MDVQLATRTRSVQLPPTADAPAAIRAFVRAALEATAPDASPLVELLTTELVSNVVRHAESAMTVRFVPVGATVRVEVDDDSDAPPVLLDPAPQAESGRGLLLVESLSSEWGWTARDRGKTVWFVVELEGAPTRQ
jgi:anti-sigma regulatory factor (Ser/Thr protein kinase)